ncbi:endonuclease V [Nonomuraea monospora]|uniref:Endonuclease V n=1 Tax=Nonomuraea monospora TaxID=568818 RepID=A0ABN3CJP4_9ACTN
MLNPPPHPQRGELTPGDLTEQPRVRRDPGTDDHHDITHGDTLGRVHVKQLHPWPSGVAEAESIQDRLRGEVELTGPDTFALVAGLDVHYRGDDALTAAVVVLDAGTLEPVEEVVAHGETAFPYVPGLFAFRELPALVAALEQLTVTPDLLVCDGHGLAHPRGFGLACHLGVLTGLPSLGVGKTPFVGTHEPPGPGRGAWAPIIHEGAAVGRALRTQRGVKPVYVSQGHRISLDVASSQVLHLTPHYRLPEPIRHADHLARHPH